MSKVKFNKRFFCIVLTIIIVAGIIPAARVAALSSLGGWNQVTESAEVYEKDTGIYLGNVDPGEGVTVLDALYSGCPYPAYYIEYNTLSGPKQGYVRMSAFRYNNKFPDSACGVVTTSGNTYYSPSTALYAGAVSAGETIAVLCNNGSWAYIEYNVGNAMRKRAFIQSSKIHSYSQARTSFYHQNSNIVEYPTVSSTTTVYSGPNGASYATIGSVDTDDNTKMKAYWYFEDKDGDVMYYISYPTTSGTKYGYIYA